MTSSEMPLRIAFYSPRLPDSGGSNGIITYTKIMRAALRSLGHEVLIITPEVVELADGNIVPVPRSNRALVGVQRILESRLKDGSNPWARMRLKEAFRVARKADVQILEMEESFGWAGHLAGRGVPIVTRLHGPHAFIRSDVETIEQRVSSNQREEAEKCSLSKVQAITSPTGRLLEAVIKLSGSQPPLSKIIPNPIPVASPAEKWDIGRIDPHQVLFVGRFDRCKGADVVLRAFARAIERRPSLKLLMVGPDLGFANEGGGLTHFQDFVATEISPDARKRISYLGEQPANEVSRLRLGSAVAVVGSRFENFPYSIAEAMAQGMPIITSATFGGSEMIRDGREGRVVPIGDVQATSTAILEMLGNRERLAAMGQSAFDRVGTWLSPNRVAENTVHLYRRVLAGALTE